MLIVYFRMNGEKIEILLIKGAQQCASIIFVVTEIEKSQLRTQSRSLRQKEDSDSTPLAIGLQAFRRGSCFIWLLVTHVTVAERQKLTANWPLNDHRH